MSDRTDRRHSTPMKIARRVLGGFLMLAAALVVTVFIVVQCSRRPFTPPETAGWQTGDVFFSAGNSWRSLIVRLWGGKSDDGATHCGFVLMVDGEPMLVHMSTAKNVITMESIEEYARINDVSAITARRLPEVPDTMRLRSDLMRLLSQGKRFDNGFNHVDTSEYYCTELVVRELGRLGNPIFNDLLRQDYIYPVDLESRLLPIK